MTEPWPVHTVVFDLDDTLCGYWEASKVGLRSAFEKHPIVGQTPDSMIRNWGLAFRKFSPTLKQTGWYETYLQKGEPTRTEQMRLALLEVGIHDEVLAKSLSETYAEERDRALRLFPDTLLVLDELRDRFPLGLITNGPADIQRQEIRTLLIESYFDPILIEGEMGIGKPHRQVFQAAENARNLKPSQLLFVGNSYAHDILPALEYGWKAIWIRKSSDVPPSRNAPESKPDNAPEPTAIIENLSELLGFLP